MDRYTDGIVTTPINVADLSQLLNRSQENINKVEYSNLLTSVGGLCTHPNINKWSKRKPVNSSILFADENALDEIMFNANYGIDTSNMGGHDAQNLAENTDADTDDYRYIHVSAPFQLGHFIKYNHKAVCPISVEWQQNDTDYGQSLSATLNLTQQDLDGLSIIKSYVASQGKELADYTFAIAILQNGVLVGFSYAQDSLKENYDEYSREIGCYLNELEGMIDNVSTHGVAMLIGNDDDAISLNANGGAISQTFVYDSDAASTALQGITCVLDSFIFERDTSYTSTKYAKWFVQDITHFVTIPNIVQFMARYINGKNASSLQNAKWKIQIAEGTDRDGYLYKATDNGGIGERITGWLDLVEYTFIASDEEGGLFVEDTTEYNIFAENGLFYGTFLSASGYFFTDRDTSNSATDFYTYRIRMMLRAGGDTDTYREIAFASTDIQITSNGDIAEM